MTCDDIERDEIAERYLLGRLSDDEQARFESHYFDCANCLERLRVLEAAQAMLARDAASTREVPRSPVARPAATRGNRGWWRAAAALATAAMVFLSVRTLQQPALDAPADRGGQTVPGDDRRPAPPPQREVRGEVPWERLGAIDPPPYSPMRLRSEATDAQREFRSAMTLYSARDYVEAAPRLRRVLALPGAPVDAHFYLAVCELQTGRLAEAASAFERVIGFGESPYLEDAHFFLAKVRVRQHDAAAARAQLRRVVALDGDRREEALQLIAQLPE